MDNLDDLRQHYDETDLSADLKAAIDDGTAQWDDTADEDPMVGTSLRLQRSLLQRIRSLAGQKKMPTTMFMRSLLVKALADSDSQDTDSAQLAAEVNALRGQVDELRDVLLAIRQDLRRAPAGPSEMPPARVEVLPAGRNGKPVSWLGRITQLSPQGRVIGASDIPTASKMPVKIKRPTVPSKLWKAGKTVEVTLTPAEPPIRVRADGSVRVDRR
jgi:hypothetical protein